MIKTPFCPKIRLVALTTALKCTGFLFKLTGLLPNQYGPAAFGANVSSPHLLDVVVVDVGRLKGQLMW